MGVVRINQVSLPGCLLVTMILIAMLPILLILMAGFVLYLGVCRLLGVRSRRPAFEQYFRRYAAGGKAGNGGFRPGTPPPEAEEPHRRPSSRPASEDVIDVVAVEVTETVSREHKRLEN